MMSNDSNKRSQVRIPVDEEIFVRDTISGLEMGTLANIHVEGFMVISDGGLKEDQLYQVILEVGHGNDDIQLAAECLWISETGTGDQVWAGFQIMKASDAAKQQIEALLTQYEAE
jgi:PilZ domain